MRFLALHRLGDKDRVIVNKGIPGIGTNPEAGWRLGGCFLDGKSSNFLKEPSFCLRVMTEAATGGKYRC
jgi:hypothetical protein